MIGAPRFVYSLVDHWPPLAWLARCPRHDRTVTVAHGPMVETTPEYFCEAVWPGPFAAGDMDRSDLTFGSAGRLRGSRAVFVSSAATVDRLHVLDVGGAIWISNSLACLTAAVHTQVDTAYPGYYRDFKSIARGLTRYRRTLPTSAGPVRLAYCENLEWDGQALRRTAKPWGRRDFSDFVHYRDFLEVALEAISHNLRDPSRRHPYRLGGTMSSGYDSATVAVLARPAGLSEVISFDLSRGGADDSGRAVAARLGLRLVLFSRAAWRQEPAPEIPFIAADAKGEEVYFAPAASWLAGRVLLTGFLGDETWDRTTSLLRDDFVRGDVGGLSLAEFRLRVGFIHCPVPFMGARQLRDINRISRSPEMAAWHTGGRYSRPICRRILEEAGVPRTLIAPEKRQASVLLFDRDTFLSPSGRDDYLAWLREYADAWRREGRTPPARVPGRTSRLRGIAGQLARVLLLISRLAPGARHRGRSLAAWLSGYARREPLFAYTFPWALDRAAACYGSPAQRTLAQEATA